MTTRDRIRTDLAVLEDAARFSFVVGGIDFWRGSFPEERLDVLKAGDAPRQRIKDLACCNRKLAELGVKNDDSSAA
jgi:hypothetical protein